MKEIVLCDLQCGNAQMTCWLDKHPKLRVDAIISLADYTPERKWTVKKIYESAQPHFWQDFDKNRNWDNNNYDKHEGLKL